MRTASMTMAAHATVLWAGMALAAPTAQQNCDNARITAWAKYAACVDAAVAKVAKGVTADQNPAFAKCRHTYFNNWGKFQSKYAGTTCSGDRFTAPSVPDGTVTDNLTGLVWELKDDLDGVADSGNPHDADNQYTWSWWTSQSGTGTAFRDFLAGAGGLNLNAFAGSVGWRLPTLAELQTILKDFACAGTFGGSTCTCGPPPCVDPALDAGNTWSYYYWSSTTLPFDPSYAWNADFYHGSVYYDDKSFDYFIRGVRGGL